MRRAALLQWLARIPPAAREDAIESWLGIADDPPPSTPPAPHLVGYHASGLTQIVRMLVDTPVLPDDVFVDIGAGLGKVALLADLLTDATVRGIEVQPELVRRARASAWRLQAKCELVVADVADAPAELLADGTVFFLYLPFTGPVLERVVGRLHDVARHHPIVVCTLGLDVDRQAPWLERRPSDSFWLNIYDSDAGAARARARATSPLALSARAAAEAIVLEQRCHDEGFESPPGPAHDE